ncbi:MAG: twin-arginine translocase TatA/TatE family subunit [Candidatus Methylomirabilia bacterium]
MLDIGLQELILIFVIALLVFGPKRLPELGQALGRAMREFRRASEEFRSTLETNLELNEPDPVLAPVESPPDESPSQEVATELADGSELDSPSGEEALSPRTEAPIFAEPYLAHRTARLFHTRECRWVGRIPEPDRIYFKRVAEAREQGFTSCPVCEPWEEESE